jgi:ribosomal-protein-alanine N-acetyltransferase
MNRFHVKRMVCHMCINIRPIQEFDNDLIRELWRNNEVRKYLGGSICNDKDIDLILLKMITPKNIDDKYLVIEYSNSKCGLVSIDKYHEIEEKELSFQFLPLFWGKGIAYSSIKLILTKAKKEMNIKKIFAETQEKNVRSRNLLKRLGMVEKERLIRFEEKQIVYELDLGNFV